MVFKGAGDTADIVQLLEAGGNYFWLIQRINNATLCSWANYTKWAFGLFRDWDTWPDVDRVNARTFVYLGAGCRRRRKWCRADSPHRWDWSLPCSPSCFQKPLKIPSMCNTHTQNTAHWVGWRWKHMMHFPLGTATTVTALWAVIQAITKVNVREFGATTWNYIAASLPTASY